MTIPTSDSSAQDAGRTQMATITPEQEQAIASYFEGKHIPSGLGSEEEACSIAGINLALTGHLTDDIPDCMSPVIGRWIIRVQDSMPDEMRNSAEWRSLLPFAAGTGRDEATEKLRRDIILDWMWGTVLPQIQPFAEKRGYGPQWLAMTTTRTTEAASTARAAANAAANAAYANAADAAAAAANANAAAAANAANAADAAAYAANANAAAAAYAAAYAADAARGKAKRETWEQNDPIGLLRQLVEVQ